MKHHTELTEVLRKNLVYLRRVHRMSLEEVAEAAGVSRQAVSKWESGETVPDLLNCNTLAELYGVSLDDMLHQDGTETGVAVGPKGKHIFGTTRLGERGQVVIPKAARDLLDLKAGDLLMVLGDENPGSRGVALVPAEAFQQQIKTLMNQFYPKEGT